jgi:hypothetical protein
MDSLVVSTFAVASIALSSEVADNLCSCSYVRLYYEIHQVQQVIACEVHLAMVAFCVGVRDDPCVAF